MNINPSWDRSKPPPTVALDCSQSYENHHINLNTSWSRRSSPGPYQNQTHRGNTHSQTHNGHSQIHSHSVKSLEGAAFWNSGNNSSILPMSNTSTLGTTMDHNFSGNTHFTGHQSQHHQRQAYNPNHNSGTCIYSSSWSTPAPPPQHAHQYQWNQSQSTSTNAATQWDSSHPNSDSPPRMNSKKFINTGYGSYRIKQAAHWDSFNNNNNNNMNHQRDSYSQQMHNGSGPDWNVPSIHAQKQSGYMPSNTFQPRWNNEPWQSANYEACFKQPHMGKVDPCMQIQSGNFTLGGTANTPVNNELCPTSQNQFYQPEISRMMPNTYADPHSKAPTYEYNHNSSYLPAQGQGHSIGHWNASTPDEETDMIWRDPKEKEKRRDRDLGLSVWGDPRKQKKLSRWMPFPNGEKPIEVPEHLGWGYESITPPPDNELQNTYSTEADLLRNRATSIQEQLQNAIAKGYVRMDYLQNREMSPDVLKLINQLLSKVPRLEQATCELEQLSMAPTLTPIHEAELARLNMEVDNLKLEIAIMQSRINDPTPPRGSVSSVGSSRLHQWKRGEHSARLHSDGVDCQPDVDIGSLFEGMTLGDKPFNLVDPLDDIILDTSLTVPSRADPANDSHFTFSEDINSYANLNRLEQSSDDVFRKM